MTGGQPSADFPRDVLARLVGSWCVRGEWTRGADKAPLSIKATAVGAWIMKKRTVEFDQYAPDGTHAFKMLCTYDPSACEFVLFAVSVRATHCEHERAEFDASRPDELVFRGAEAVKRDEPPIRYARAITFVSGGGFDMDITYPDLPRRVTGGMELRFRPADRT